MDDPSITKRLIDFGTNEHEYDEVQELPDESVSNQQPQQHTGTNSSSNNNNNNNSSSSSSTNVQSATTALQTPPQQQQPTLQAAAAATVAFTGEKLPPELPPPKQKSVKNSKKSKSKSKIPRSPSLASTVSGSSASSCSVQPQQQSAIPPQTPPLPLNFQSKVKHMNGSTATATPFPSSTAVATATGAAITDTAAVTPTALATPHALLNNSSSIGSSGSGNNNDGGCGSTNNNNINNKNSIMGGGVQVNSGANGATNNRGSLNMASSRRPQIQISPIAESPKHFQFLTLTVRKDEIGYGMKVSGDNPVFVESVKPGGAAQIAGLVAGDMILKVNGQEVRSEKHPTVVNLIKASTTVELAVKRSHKMARPNSVGIVPTTPILSGRDRTASITGPQPVDSIKRREMETYKIQTLQKMIEQEKLNLERLKGDTNNPSYKLSEANIRTLREQLRQVGAEDAPAVKYQPTANNKNTAMLSPNQIHHLSASYHHNLSHNLHHHHHNQHQQQHQATTPQPQTHSSPAFLSLLPRSLSSLSLGTRKAKIDKDTITSPLNNTTDFLHTSTASPMSQSLHQSHLQPLPQHRNSQQQLFYQQQHQLQQLQQQQQLLQQRLKETSSKLSSSSSSSKNKNKFAAQAKNLIQEDVPPPLPQRNPPRQLLLDASSNNNNNTSNSVAFAPISDLDHTHVGGMQRNVSPQPVAVATAMAVVAPTSTAASTSSSSAQKKRSKTKTKALSDPKMSTQMFLQMETACGGGGGGVECGGLFDGDSEMDCVPPPLPPRQPGMLEEPQALLKGSFQNLSASANPSAARPPPNSIDNILNYPLVSTCTAVQRDNMSAAFPLSQRPNIVQQLQQHQQQQQQLLSGAGGCGQTVALGQTPHNVNHMNRHRRVVSSPDNMHPRHPDRHHKTTSGTWELVEKDGEVTPPGTPPPPYLTAHSAGLSGIDDPLREAAGSPTGGMFAESHFAALTAAAAVGCSPSHATPAGSHSSRIQAAQSNASQKEIISMEDEDASDHDGTFIDENGPFNYLQRLLEAENVAFLAVFLNYVLSNSEPAPLLFYLITGLYKEGTAKDMRKWAYEIHSTFLVPRAPLAWYRQGESLAREVDNVLQSEFDKVEILRKVFWKSRKRARDIICEQLREFQQKRTAGLGTIYGPTDAELNEAKGDKQREQHIFEETLLQKLHTLIDEYDKEAPIEDAKKAALCSALSTVIHRIFITRSHPNSIIDRMHHFVSREKSFKSRLMGKHRKMVVRGHPLVLHQYYEVTHCNHCQNIIWGVSPQGYHCTDCKLNIHRPCSKVLDENCPGPLPQAKRKDPHNDNKISKFMGKIRPRTSSDFIAMEKRARHEDDFDTADTSHERLHATSIVRQPSDRRPDAGNVSVRSNGNASHNSSDLQSSFHASTTEAGAVGDGASLAASGGAAGIPATAAAIATAMGADANAQDAADSKDARRERLHQQHQQNKSAPVSVNRSESYKERLSHKRNRNSRRKTSDPNLTSRPNDDAGLSNSNYTASSNSSLSSGGGSESPSTSMEQVGGGAAAASAVAAQPHAAHVTHGHHAPHHTHQHSHQDSFHSRNFESAEEDDLNEVDWSSNVAAEVLAALTDAEKKRQEIINEIYQTERSHVRTLKLLERVFFYPLQESNMLTIDDLKLLFPPAMLSLRDLHGTFEQKLKQRRLEHNHVVCNVGDLLASMFDGQPGDELCEFAAQFCARQQIALEALKEKRRKDEQLQKILSKAEAHKACRRLQLKDLLPTVLHRFTKYPLLFENLYKVTVRVVPHDTAEADAIQRALESSKKILVDVNQAVKTAEDSHKLQNIQRKLDKSTFDKDEFIKNLDLTQYRLIHDGSLTMKKNPSIQLHGLLFENMIVLLTKQDDKYSLKYLHAARNTEVNNKPVSPIMNIDAETLVRQEAADKNSFFLIKTRTSQMLELRAPSSSECKTWFKHISDAAEQYKPRSKNASHEPVDDPAIATLPHSNIRESIELTPERPPPLSATATVTTTPLAPMLPIATATSATFSSNAGGGALGSDTDVQLRNGRRESTPTASDKQRLGQQQQQQELASVNRTLSTRSCGETMTSAGASSSSDVATNGVTLRHTQSARSANTNAPGPGGPATATASVVVADGGAATDGSSKRNSASIVYSNNSNNTRTLMQSSALVEPTAIQISISPAHTAVPVLTPAERLRRLDASIRDGLLEKQMIICDMFRLPVEHFHEIMDIAAMPEAPKDSADIALAAYAQVQSLTEVLNDYMHVTPEQEISAVSTAVCDQCHEKQQQQRPLTPLAHGAAAAAVSATTSSASSSASAKTQITAERTTSASSSSDMPPPLPPPNKPSSAQTAQAQTPSMVAAESGRAAMPVAMHEPEDIHEDDDGYCEIDELRLPALPSNFTPAAAIAPCAKATSPPPPLPPPAGTFKTPPPPPPPPSALAAAAAAAAAASVSTPTPELIKRQSTISADSIPEESADEVTKAMDDVHVARETITAVTPTVSIEVKPICEGGDAKEENTEPKDGDDQKDESAAEKSMDALDVEATIADKSDDDLASVRAEEDGANAGTAGSGIVDDTSSATNEPQKSDQQQHSASSITDGDGPSSLGSNEHIEINDAYDTLASLNNLSSALAMVDGMTQTVPMAAFMATMMMGSGSSANNGGLRAPSPCGSNRLQHANSLQPSVPCHALYSIVGALNAQISLLLPKINERDMERERLRKENQHLRELLNAMHERQRVEAKLATPTDISLKADANDDIDGSISDLSAERKAAVTTVTTTTTTTPTATDPAATTTAATPIAEAQN